MTQCRAAYWCTLNGLLLESIFHLFFPHLGQLISYFYWKVGWLSAATPINERVSPQYLALTLIETCGIKMCISENNFNVRSEDIIPPKRESLGKNMHCIWWELRSVYITQRYIMGGGVFFRIVWRRSCVLRASAGLEAQLHGSEWTYNWQHLNHQQLSDPMLQCKTHTHTEPFSSANEAFERGWRA